MQVAVTHQEIEIAEVIDSLLCLKAFVLVLRIMCKYTFVSEVQLSIYL